MFVSTLFIQALFATVAFAIPTSQERYEKRSARRSGGLRRQSASLAVNATNAVNSPNWGGPVLETDAVRLPFCASGRAGY